MYYFLKSQQHKVNNTRAYCTDTEAFKLKTIHN